MVLTLVDTTLRPDFEAVAATCVGEHSPQEWTARGVIETVTRGKLKVSCGSERCGIPIAN